MPLYTIADLHLSFGVSKPMDIFGGRWQGYAEKIDKNLNNLLEHDDVLVIGGDVSWGINLNQSKADFLFLESIKCKKIILKGNHDLWWATVSKMNSFFEQNNIKNIEFLHNNFFTYKDTAICGTRGWAFEENFKDPHNEKIFKRELLRLESSLKQAKEAGFEKIYCFMHYPPIYHNFRCQEIIDIMNQYGVSKCIYGHLHSESIKYAKTGVIDGIEYILTSADFLNFMPIMLEK